MRYSQVLFEAAKRISSSLSTDEVLKAIVESTAHAVNAKGCSLLLLSPDKKQLRHSATYGLSDWFVKKGPLSADKSFSQALEGKPVQALNAAEDRNVQYRWHMKKEGIASLILSISSSFLPSNALFHENVFNFSKKTSMFDSLDIFNSSNINLIVAFSILRR